MFGGVVVVVCFFFYSEGLKKQFFCNSQISAESIWICPRAPPASRQRRRCNEMVKESRSKNKMGRGRGIKPPTAARLKAAGVLRAENRGTFETLILSGFLYRHELSLETHSFFLEGVGGGGSSARCQCSEVGRELQGWLVSGAVRLRLGSIGRSHWKSPGAGETSSPTTARARPITERSVAGGRLGDDIRASARRRYAESTFSHLCEAEKLSAVFFRSS